jgi:ABC-type multidrug transport system fused ATPase/permease subunit
MRKVIRLLLVLLTPREKRHASYVFILMILVALSETIGVASIIPFMTAVSDSSSLEKSGIIGVLFRFFGEPDDKKFILILGACFILFLFITLALKTVSFWAQSKYSKMRVHFIGIRLLERYLTQSYAWYLNQHTSRLSTNILNEVNQVVSRSMFPVMQLFANSIVAVALLTFLFVIDPILALSAIVFLSVAYGGIYFIFRKPLFVNGKKRYAANLKRYKIIQEIFGGIKDVKVKDLELTMKRRFQGPSYHTANQEVKIDLMKQLPGFFMQGVLTVGMIVALLYLHVSLGSLSSALPAFSAFAYAGYRLMPSLQQIYRHTSSIRSALPSLEALVEDYTSLEDNIIGSQMYEIERVTLNQAIELENISYSYPETEKKAINSLNMIIPAYSRIGIVGTTGSGKTTLIDIILGLLSSESGSMKVDGVKIDNSNLLGWRKTVGYVPQQIFLADETIAGNIAFGIPEEDIDMVAVEKAAKIANLHEFILEQLDQGYDTTVGERGVRLSGGQRQRIGIARALYHEPDLIIMDEATSALDNITENAVMKSVENLSDRVTIILIAHRLTTVQSCDIIYLLENGNIKASGSYDKLLESSADFRNLSQIEH